MPKYRFEDVRLRTRLADEIVPMPYRNMTLEDFARFTGMDARDVRKQADRGKLPGMKIGGQWRFHRARVTEWLQQAMPNLDPDQLTNIDRAMAELAQGAEEQMLLTAHMGVESIELNLAARTRDSVLRELVKLAERSGLLYDSARLLEAVMEREKISSTALPNGVAIPHPQSPLPYVSAEPLLCLGRVPKGIGFGAPDRKLTDLFFLVCSHEDRQHLQVLARLVRVLDEECCTALRAAEDPAEALALLIERERNLIALG